VALRAVLFDVPSARDLLFVICYLLFFKVCPLRPHGPHGPPGPPSTKKELSIINYQVVSWRAR